MANLWQVPQELMGELRRVQDAARTMVVVLSWAVRLEREGELEAAQCMYTTAVEDHLRTWAAITEDAVCRQVALLEYLIAQNEEIIDLLHYHISFPFPNSVQSLFGSFAT